MTGSTIGTLFKVTTFGESHGKAVGAIIDGCPAGLEISDQDIQIELDKRKPGINKYVTQRRELDKVEILSGIFEDKTTGTPICLNISNIDQKEKDYTDIKDKFRPGHGDYTYFKKYGIRDYRGGGRASARVTAADVAAGAIAKKYLINKYNIEFNSYITQIGDILIPDKYYKKPTEYEKVQNLITNLRKAGDSIGAKLKIEINNVPAGLGEPVFDKLDAKLAYAFMGINAVKAVEIGAGFDVITAKGSEQASSGGILAGISSGEVISANLAFKPTSSIRVPQETTDINGNKVEIATKGRHDVCVALRAAPIVEARAAIVLMDFILIQRGLHGNI